MAPWRRRCSRFILLLHTPHPSRFLFCRQTSSSHYSTGIPHPWRICGPAASSSNSPRPPRFLPLPCAANPCPLPWQHCLFHSRSDDDQQPSELDNQEAKKLLKLVKLADLKKHLLSSGCQTMPYVDVIKFCKDGGYAASDAGADAIAKSLDDAGLIFIYRGNVFLHPNKLAHLLASVLPAECTIAPDDPRRREWQELEKEKEEIDKIAHKQVRHVVWCAFWGLTLQSLLFFRLTFWDLSWDVMEPITFFVTSSGLIGGLLFFIFTHREPSYQDFMHTMFLNKQKKLMAKRNFDFERFKALQAQLHISGGSGSGSAVSLGGHT